MRGDGFDGSKFRFNDLEVIADKREYAPGEKVRLLVNTNRLDSTVLLFVRPVSELYPRPQVLRLKGKSTLVEIGVTQKDMPNFFVEALTLSNGRIIRRKRARSSFRPKNACSTWRSQPSAHDFKPGTKAGRETQADRPDRKTGCRLCGAWRSMTRASSTSRAGATSPKSGSIFWNWRREHSPQTQSSLDGFAENLLKPGEIPLKGIGLFGDLTQEAGGGMFGGVSKSPGVRYGMLGEFGSPVFRSDEADQQGESAAIAATRNGATGGVSGEQQSDGGIPEVQPTVRTQFADTAFWAARSRGGPRRSGRRLVPDAGESDDLENPRLGPVDRHARRPGRSRDRHDQEPAAADAGAAVLCRDRTKSSCRPTCTIV